MESGRTSERDGAARTAAKNAYAKKGEQRRALQEVQRSVGNRALAALVQAKLTISEPNDPLEHEADRVADEVMRMPEPTAVEPIMGAHRAEARIQRLCSACEEDLQRKTDAGEAPSGSDLEPYVGNLHGRGEPLTPAARSFFEPRFGVDFGAVRVHTGAEADRSARSIDALAYAAGEHIVFRAGQYAPHSPSGQRLLAHELTHVVQQSGATSVQRQAGVMRQEVHVVDGLGCPRERCAGKEDGIKSDLQRALGYTAQALSALAGKPSAATERLLDWYFTDHSDATVKTVRERLTCIRAALQDTLSNDRYGCGTRFWDVAHTGGSDTLCKDSEAPVCLDPSYFDADRSSRERAEALIHECGHRVGLSTSDLGVPDIYSLDWRFLSLSTEQALLNTDSYAMFVGALVFGARTTVFPFGGVTGGIASPGGGFFKVRVGAEVQHPSLRGVNPDFGVSYARLGAENVVSLFAGARLADARPGNRGGVYLNLAGELSLVFDDTANIAGSGVGVGGEVKLGYRIGHFDIGVAGGVLRGPSPDSGARTTLSGGLSFTYIPDWKL